MHASIFRASAHATVGRLVRFYLLWMNEKWFDSVKCGLDTFGPWSPPHLGSLNGTGKMFSKWNGVATAQQNAEQVVHAEKHR